MNKIAAFFTFFLLSHVLLVFSLLHWIDDTACALADTALTLVDMSKMYKAL